MAPRPCVHYLDPSDLERSVSDPRLVALAQAGWTVAAWSVSMVGNAGPEPVQRLTLLLWPPAPSRSAARVRVELVAAVASVAVALGTWAVVAALVLR